ncbi:MAG: class I SAM-dependent methyltransferase [Candidatus Thermoplasmatota archaeon]|nr:class I SAM-dependent methyltransferase [Candidatus Thermoplasmatota archaeon]
MVQIEDITPALRNSKHDKRNKIWKDWYDRLISQMNDNYYSFLNYGYLGQKGIDLSPSDEAVRIFLELYQVTLGNTSLKSKSILDVSSGMGGGAAWIARTHNPASLVGLDISSEAVRLCNRLYHNQPNLSFTTGDAESIPFPDSSFDVVYNVEASHCYTNFNAFVTEVFRVLRPGGYFCWSDFHSSARMRGIESIFTNSGFEMESLSDITEGVLRSLDFVKQGQTDVKRIIWATDIGSLEPVVQEFSSGERSYHCCRLFKNNSMV